METVASKDGTPIAFDRLGEGPPLILVEGALNDLTTTLPLAALLQTHFTVVVYDRRGRGASGDTQPYSVQREIEDLDSIIAEAGGPALVFGNCSGGALALEAAAQGLDIAALALYEPPFFVDGLHSVPENYSNRLAGLIAQGRGDEALELFMMGVVEIPREQVGNVRNSPLWPALLQLAPTLIYDDAVMGDCLLPMERLALVRPPTLVMEGQDSPEWARRSVHALADAVPDGHVRTLGGHSHYLAADAVAPVLKEFFINTMGFSAR